MVHLLLHHLLLLCHIGIHLHHIWIHCLHRLLLHLLLHHLLLALHFLRCSLVLLFLHLLLLLYVHFFHCRLCWLHLLLLRCRWLFLLWGCTLSRISWIWISVCYCLFLWHLLLLGVSHFYFAYLLIKIQQINHSFQN